jgi:MATE family multidrug resistance protein
MNSFAELVPTRGELREMLRLAAPIVLAQVGIMLMGVVDTAMVGRVSPETVAAVALGHIYWVNLTMPGLGLLLVLDPVISQSVGAKDHDAIARGVQRGVLLALALTIPTVLLLMPGELFFAAIRQPAGVSAIAAQFSRWSALGVLPFYLFVVMRVTLQSMGTVRAVVIAIFAANIVNAGLNWVFIYGHLGAPPLGALGSSLSTVLSRWIMFALILGLGWREIGPHLRPWRPDAARIQPLLRMVGIGVPVAFQMWLEMAVFSLGAVIIGWLGAGPLAAHEIALNLASMTFMVPLGVSGAAAAMVGRAIGRGDLAGARRDAVAAVVIGLGFMCGAAAVFLLAPGTLAHLFIADVATAKLAASLIMIAGSFQVFDGIQCVAAGILRGTGDTRVPMLLHLGGFWGIGIPLMFGLAFWAGLGPQGVWWAYVISLAAVALMQILRVRWRLAQDVQRLRIDESHEHEVPDLAL